MNARGLSTVPLVLLAGACFTERMKRQKQSGNQPLAPRRALLVDLENLAYHDSVRLDRASVRRQILYVLQEAGCVDYALAVAPRHVIRRYGAELAATGLRWEECNPGLDSADIYLVARAHELKALDFQHIVIASGDHYFHRLAGEFTLSVVVPPGASVAAQLRPFCTAGVAA